jgi:hypothetical protein
MREKTIWLDAFARFAPIQNDLKDCAQRSKPMARFLTH